MEAGSEGEGGVLLVGKRGRGVLLAGQHKHSPG